MRRGLTLCIVFFFLVCFVDKSHATPTDQSKNNETVVALLPLTGNLAFLGVPGQRAIEMALDDLAKQKHDGAPFHVTLVDTKADPKEAVTRYMEARAKYDARFFITTLTGVSEALKPLIKRDGGLQIMVAIHPKLLVDAPNAIRFCFNAAQEGREISAWLLRNNSGERKVGLLISKDATSVSETDDYLVPVLESARISYVRQDFDVGQKDLRILLQSFVTQNVRTLVVLGYGSDLPAILKQLAVADPQGAINVVGGIALIEFPEWKTATYLNRNLDFVGPSIAADGLVAAQANPVASRYASQFREKYIPYDAAFTYDAVMALSKALIQQPAAPAAVRGRILSWKTYRGVAGELTFSSNGDVATQMKWLRYRDGKLISGLE